MHWPRESLNKSPSVAPKDVEPVPTHPSGGVETVQVFKGDQIERRSMSPKGVKKPIQVFRGSVVTLQGPARTVDGDTLDMGGVRVRLYGIDAPETAQSCRLEGRRWPCGRYATQALRSQIGNREVTCEERGRDSYSRLVAACSVGGRDLSAWMIGEGWALAYRQYSLAYMAEESRARAAKARRVARRVRGPPRVAEGKASRTLTPPSARDRPVLLPAGRSFFFDENHPNCAQDFVQGLPKDGAAAGPAVMVSRRSVTSADRCSGEPAWHLP